MTLPSGSLWLVFAVGLLLGVVLYFGRAFLVGRRNRRPAFSGGGTTAEPTGAAGPTWGPAPAAEPPAPAPNPVPAPTAVPDEVATAAGPVADEPPGQESIAPPIKPAATHRSRYGKAPAPTQAAEVAEQELEPWIVDEGLAPVNAGEVAARRRKAARLAQLRKREQYLEDALDQIVGFVDGDARRPRARACARALDDILPRTRRSAELRAFINDVKGSRTVPDLQDDAEQVGIQLAIELKEVKTELLSEAP